MSNKIDNVEPGFYRYFQIKYFTANNCFATIVKTSPQHGYEERSDK